MTEAVYRGAQSARRRRVRRPWHEAGMLEKSRTCSKTSSPRPSGSVYQGYTAQRQARDPRRIQRRAADRRGRHAAAGPVRRGLVAGAAARHAALPEFLPWRATGCRSTARRRMPGSRLCWRTRPIRTSAGRALPSHPLPAGENDGRVHALHARKMAARLQAGSSPVAPGR